MKKSILSFISMHLLIFCFGQTNNVGSDINIVKNFNYARYLDSSIHSLITDNAISSYIQYSYITNQTSVLSGVKFKYGEDVFVEVYVGALSHQKAYNPNGNWNFDLLLNEKITKVRVIVNGNV